MKTIIISGLIVAITPFLGLPLSWKTFIFVGLGLLIAVKAFLGDAISKIPPKNIEGPRQTSIFAENAPDLNDEIKN